MDDRKPYIIPPPTLEELGVMPLETSGWVFRVFRIACVCIFLSAVGGGIAGYYWLEDLGVFHLDESVLQTINKTAAPDNSEVFDRHGRKIGEFFELYHVFIPYEKLPRRLIDAIIAIEDRAFFTHFGVDPKAMLRALRAIASKRQYTQGGSTITQQVVRHFFLSKEKTIARKIQEIFLAIRLEQLLSKERIFELYVNTLFLGNGAYGVGAAARRYFGKDVHELDVHELALIAGLFQSPTTYNPVRNLEGAKRRQRQVLGAMLRSGMLRKDEAVAYSLKPLALVTYVPMNQSFAPHFLDHVREQAAALLGKKLEGSGLRIYTTIDYRLQEIANSAFAGAADVFSKADDMVVHRRQVAGVRPSSIEGAMLSIDPQTGEILAMVGGRDYNRSQFNRATKSLRSPGSAFKPIVYAMALQRGWKWSDLLFVSPVSIGGYRPKNYSGGFLTETTLLRAFFQSMNTATIELGAKLGFEQVIEFAQTFGIKSALKHEPGTLLGSSELTMLDLGRIYGTFANNGVAVEPVVISKIVDRSGQVLFTAPEPQSRAQQVISPQIAYLMTEGLRSVLQHGTGRQAQALAGVAVGKTGTSDNSEDNWFVGYSANLLTAVWVGTDDHLPLVGQAAGNTLALPIWQRYMTAALQARPTVPFKRPGEIRDLKIHPMYGNRDANGIRMFFLDSNLPKASYSDFEGVSKEGNYRSLIVH